MKHLFTLLFLLASATCFAQVTRDSEPSFPQFAFNTPDSLRTEDKLFICHSKDTKAYHKSAQCDELMRCTHAVKGVTRKEAEQKYARVKCQMCW